MRNGNQPIAAVRGRAGRFIGYKESSTEAGSVMTSLSLLLEKDVLVVITAELPISGARLLQE